MTVLLTLASLAGAGVLHRKFTQEYFDVHHVGVGQYAPLSATQDIRATKVSASGVLVNNDHLLTTPSVFVGVDVEVRTRGEQLVSSGDCTLKASGASYAPALLQFTTMPSPGFQEAQRLVFEVPVDQLDRPVLRCEPTELLRWYSDAAEIDLGLTPDKVRELAAAASQGMTVPKVVTTVVQQ